MLRPLLASLAMAALAACATPSARSGISTWEQPHVRQVLYDGRFEIALPAGAPLERPSADRYAANYSNDLRPSGCFVDRAPVNLPDANRDVRNMTLEAAIDLLTATVRRDRQAETKSSTLNGDMIGVQKDFVATISVSNRTAPALFVSRAYDLGAEYVIFRCFFVHSNEQTVLALRPLLLRLFNNSADSARRLR